MRVYVFERVERASNKYHPEGGLVIVARDRDHAHELLMQHPSAAATDDEWAGVVAYDLAGQSEPRVWVFPDTGCC